MVLEPGTWSCKKWLRYRWKDDPFQTKSLWNSQLEVLNFAVGSFDND